MEPAAMPLVIVEDMPAINKASANTTAALLPSKVPTVTLPVAVPLPEFHS